MRRHESRHRLASMLRLGLKGCAKAFLNVQLFMKVLNLQRRVGIIGPRSPRETLEGRYFQRRLLLRWRGHSRLWSSGSLSRPPSLRSVLTDFSNWHRRGGSLGPRSPRETLEGRHFQRRLLLGWRGHSRLWSSGSLSRPPSLRSVLTDFSTWHRRGGSLGPRLPLK